MDPDPLGGNGANGQGNCFDLGIDTNLRTGFPEPTLSFSALAYRALGHTLPARDFSDGNLASAIQLFCANPINHRDLPRYPRHVDLVGDCIRAGP